MSEPITDSSANTPTATFLAALLAVPYGLWTVIVEAGHAFAAIGAAIHTGAATLISKHGATSYSIPTKCWRTWSSMRPSSPRIMPISRMTAHSGLQSLRASNHRASHGRTSGLVLRVQGGGECGQPLSSKGGDLLLGQIHGALVYVRARVYAPHLHICRK